MFYFSVERKSGFICYMRLMMINLLKYVYIFHGQDLMACSKSCRFLSSAAADESLWRRL